MLRSSQQPRPQAQVHHPPKSVQPASVNHLAQILWRQRAWELLQGTAVRLGTRPMVLKLLRLQLPEQLPVAASARAPRQDARKLLLQQTQSRALIRCTPLLLCTRCLECRVCLHAYHHPAAASTPFKSANNAMNSHDRTHRSHLISLCCGPP